MLMTLKTSCFESHLLPRREKKKNLSELMEAAESEITPKPIPQFKQRDRKIWWTYNISAAPYLSERGFTECMRRIRGEPVP